MSDTYMNVVNSGFAQTLAKKLGLPQPAPLRRFRKDAALLPGPVLVLGPDPHGSDSDKVAATLLSWDLDVHRDPTTSGIRWGAIILVLTQVENPGELAASGLGPRRASRHHDARARRGADPIRGGRTSRRRRFHALTGQGDARRRDRERHRLA